jgi:hypothetical protein
MTKVVCVGCSWTDGFGDHEVENTYPYIIKENFPDWEVFNLGLRGCNNYFINIILERAIERIRPDFVIHQVTNWNRWMYYDLEYYVDLFLQDTDIPGYYTLDSHRYVKDIAMWTVSCLSHPYPKILSKTEISRRGQLRIDHYNLTSTGLVYELEDMSLYKTEALLKNVPHMMLFWRDNKQCLPSFKRWNRYPCVERDLGFDLVVDEGKHFLKDGNTQLVEKMILPRLMNV